MIRCMCSLTLTCSRLSILWLLVVEAVALTTAAAVALAATGLTCRARQAAAARAQKRLCPFIPVSLIGLLLALVGLVAVREVSGQTVLTLDLMQPLPREAVAARTPEA